MSDYYQIIAGALLTCILYLFLIKQGKDTAILLSITVCCMIVSAAVGYLRPIIAFFEQLLKLGNIDTQLFEILMKAVCIGLLGEIVCLICTDSGNTALGKGVQMLTVTVVIWVALPMLSELLSLIDSILASV